MENSDPTGSLCGASWAFFFCGAAMIHFFLSDVGKASSTHTEGQAVLWRKKKTSHPHHPSAALAPQARPRSCGLYPLSTVGIVFIGNDNRMFYNNCSKFDSGKNLLWEKRWSLNRIFSKVLA
ncbi:MAG: hypothetical protein IPM53_25285 [Anaerolineaceae bacterium]|nr:hypothetical protein [Anaerolineaceae bacterium]